MALTFREDYWDSPELKKELINFINQIHRLDLTLWDEKGYWDRKYRPFSFFEGNRIVSSVCIYSMDMTIDGKRSLVAQVSAVGTLPEYRRKGLNLELSKRAMEWAEDNHDFFFLFADEEAFPFYKRCGFRQVNEHKARLALTGMTARPGAVKLDVSTTDNLDMIYRIASNREPVSNVLGVTNEKLFMFWCLYFLKDFIYYIADLDILVLYERKNGVLTIFDIVGTHVPVFSELYPCICDESDSAVEFMFMMDKLGLDEIEYVKVEGNGTHLYGNFPLENSKFIFPLTAHA
ncbi:MAG: GNAT family N-acetyltransferase [candidate division Zixibacteria bacterium]|nr:GNAT family N-acetyltransferase [candidate division Zixibacteria bacterium]MBU1471406.1 GNAT family N-acetyltransferase [candidate division Zixibacteria bacterium]MBU2626803.1 GNAT family N-acetyltransferase [candidate division Zixibacteria bacterium]